MFLNQEKPEMDDFKRKKNIVLTLFGIEGGGELAPSPMVFTAYLLTGGGKHPPPLILSAPIRT